MPAECLEHTAWVGAQDDLLMPDRNANGVIENGEPHPTEELGASAPNSGKGRIDNDFENTPMDVPASGLLKNGKLSVTRRTAGRCASDMRVSAITDQAVRK